MTRIKICGLRRPEDVAYVNAFHPDACGFILSKPFRRYVTKEQLRVLKDQLEEGITAFGVFVNEPPEEILSFVKEGLIDAVQLHGEEDNDYIRQLKKQAPCVKVMKAFTVQSLQDLEQAAESCADLILLDSGKGTGKTFRWQLLQDFRRPYVLAGGLNPDNVREAVAALAPYGVDTSSGVETDGYKDREKIRLFIERAKEV